MKLPAYPIATIDPHFSIWSRTDKLTEKDTDLWCGIKKRIEGKITVDSEVYRFLGCGEGKALEQTDAIITPYVSEYLFEGEGFNLKFTTWSPFLFDDFHLLSAPCAYFDVEVNFFDGKAHTSAVEFTAFKELCQGNKDKAVTKYTEKHEGYPIVKMGLTKQEPLNDSGDTYAADWGYVCLGGGKCSVSKNGILIADEKNGGNTHAYSFVIAYDDVYSINYFGEYLKGLWTEKFATVEEIMKYCADNRAELFERIRKQEEMILFDSAEFGENYQNMLAAAARQVLAGHKLVRNAKGELLYLSKECHSNGCINTVDVSYPALPMYLLYTPELVKAMLVGIFAFASMPLWNEPFAPHDIGRYPLACGQVYALNPHAHLVPHKVSYKKIYKSKGKSIYMKEFQMPVEECGNMLVMTYAYYKATGDIEFVKENFHHLTMWANYLKGKGVVLDNQLCTDDFAGHSKKNVNLAIKGIMGMACFSRLCDVLGIENDFIALAKDYADELCKVCEWSGSHLPFSVGKKDSWSLKYNLVWDKIFAFGLFDKALYKAESDKYIERLNAYGVPLDYRKDFTKTDWMLWAACLDDTFKNVDIFSGRILAYLADTKDRNCFSDWVETKTPKQRGFSHRTVQAGLWMPVLAKKWISE